MTSKLRSRPPKPSPGLYSQLRQGGILVLCGLATFGVVAAYVEHGYDGAVSSEIASIIGLDMSSDTLGGMIKPLIGGLVLFFIMAALVKGPGRQLQSKFQRLGVLQGRTRAEIEAAVGAPNSVSGTGDGREVCQWLATGYHVALIFAGDRCEGISHEYGG